MDRNDRTSTPVKAEDVPNGLEWIEEPPKEEYTVKIALAPVADGVYRRVTFRDGTNIYALLTYKRRISSGERA